MFALTRRFRILPTGAAKIEFARSMFVYTIWVEWFDSPELLKDLEMQGVQIQTTH